MPEEFLLLVFLLLYCMCNSQPGRIFSLPLDLHSLTISLELQNNHIYGLVKINDSGELSFLFDNRNRLSRIMVDSDPASETRAVTTEKLIMAAADGWGDF